MWRYNSSNGEQSAMSPALRTKRSLRAVQFRLTGQPLLLIAEVADAEPQPEPSHTADTCALRSPLHIAMTSQPHEFGPQPQQQGGEDPCGSPSWQSSYSAARAAALAVVDGNRTPIESEHERYPNLTEEIAAGGTNTSVNAVGLAAAAAAASMSQVPSVEIADDLTFDENDEPAAVMPVCTPQRTMPNSVSTSGQNIPRDCGSEDEEGPLGEPPRAMRRRCLRRKRKVVTYSAHRDDVRANRSSCSLARGSKLNRRTNCKGLSIHPALRPATMVRSDEQFQRFGALHSSGLPLSATVDSQGGNDVPSTPGSEASSCAGNNHNDDIDDCASVERGSERSGSTPSCLTCNAVHRQAHAVGADTHMNSPIAAPGDIHQHLSKIREARSAPPSAMGSNRTSASEEPLNRHQSMTRVTRSAPPSAMGKNWTSSLEKQRCNVVQGGIVDGDHLKDEVWERQECCDQNADLVPGDDGGPLQSDDDAEDDTGSMQSQPAGYSCGYANDNEGGYIISPQLCSPTEQPAGRRSYEHVAAAAAAAATSAAINGLKLQRQDQQHSQREQQQQQQQQHQQQIHEEQQPGMSSSEQPTTVRLRLWSFDPSSSGGGNKLLEDEGSKPLLTIPHGVVCSERSVDVSQCGRLLAMCVACQPRTHGQQQGHQQGGRSMRLMYELRVYSLEPSRYGEVLAAAPIRAAQCVTSVQFSPTSERILVAYGKRSTPLLRAILAKEQEVVPIYTSLEVYRLDTRAGSLRIERSVTSSCEELNVALFNPMPGGGIACGTKEGSVRLLRRRRRGGRAQREINRSERLEEALLQRGNLPS